ncbi:S8 family serine peptidase [Bradyrhizobium sp. LTSP885]|uniref:S8 family serine peptidase n=1 Tax=Bradyrhizobium sp. LTSP885 TaxID=1619232 RepID=UPI000699402E|nr:S8 family serine peptidase [Bradyrhizobium sp. LTSP885]
MKRPHDGFDAFGDNFLANWDGLDPTGDAMDSSGSMTPAMPVTGTLLAHVAPAQVLGGEVSDLNAGLAALTQPAASAFEPIATLASLANPISGTGGGATSSAVSSGGATAAQVQQALNESGLSVNGSGIKVGVISDSFNNQGGAAADEASGALPSAANIQVLEDRSSGGTDEGRAMMQIVHDIAPGASLAFYTADVSEQDFANGILALAAAGCKVICDDVSYYDEPFFQNGVVAQAIQTVEAEGVTYITAAGNNASNAYQAAWTPISGVFDGYGFVDAESFGGSMALNITVTASTTNPSPLLLEWNQAYGSATADLVLNVFQNGTYLGSVSNRSVGSSTNPWTALQFTASGTYQIVIDNLSSIPNSDPTLIKLISAADGLPVTISGANSGTVYGHAMTPGAITAGAVSAASTPAFGTSAQSEVFSSSGAGTELLFANNGTALSSPDLLSPVVVSGLDDIATTVSGNLSDFYGTSAASASLAGVAALMLAADPNLTPAQVEQIMEQTALPMANSAVSGAGLVQVNAAVAAAMALNVVVIEAIGSTELAQTGSHYFLDPVAGGTGPTLKYQGAAITVGEFAGWSPIGAEATSTGYDVAWKLAGADQYTVWATDANGNDTVKLVDSVSGSSTALESLETTFHQDLNGDHVIGIVSTAIESQGSTSLVQVGNVYDLNPVGGGTGPTLKYQGAAITVGEFAGWSPIGAEATSTGYDVAWKLAGADQYTVWATDANGNDTVKLVDSISGSSTALESLETTLHQDLNGDGVIGIPSTTIESHGSTSLVQVGNIYDLNPVGGGTGPTLKYQGSAITVGEFAGWSPIGAEATSTGYDVAWKLAGADQYTVWATDANGNDTVKLVDSVSGSSTALESLETTLHQDLNGDGVIGIVSTTIESHGSTSLVQVGNVYDLNPVGGGTGPTLKYQGAAITVGEFAGWSPIGAEATSTGYDVAWKLAGADQYTVWATDANGNDTVKLVDSVSGSSTALESLETTFHQDLNGDGTTGIPANQSSVHPVQSFASAALAGEPLSGSSFFFRAEPVVNTIDADLLGFIGPVPRGSQPSAFSEIAALDAPSPADHLGHEFFGGLGDLSTAANIKIADLHSSATLIH